MADAKRRAHGEGLPEARALLLWLLARNDHDDEARALLGRVDLREGCVALAEKSFREVLSRHPKDTDTQAGLVDVLFAQARYEEATAVIERGLRDNPESPDLLVRQARLAYWRGDLATATKSARRAALLSPRDPDMVAMRDRMFTGEARVGIRHDRLPDDYPDNYTISATLMQNWRRFRFTLDSQILDRTSALMPTATVDWRRTAGVQYSPGVGTNMGLELGYGGPARFVPLYTGRVFGTVPVTDWFTGTLSYAAWMYPNSKWVHIWAGSVGFAPLPEFRFEARSWLAYVTISPDARRGTDDLALSYGPLVAWRARNNLEFGASYTYGVQLDQNPAIVQLLTLRSHIVAAYADWLIERTHGVRPSLGIERRDNESTGVSMWISTVEASFYVRW